MGLCQSGNEMEHVLGETKDFFLHQVEGPGLRQEPGNAWENNTEEESTTPLQSMRGHP